MLTWFARGQDGRTAYHRVRGRPFSGKLLLFAESCRYKARSQEPLRGRERWSQCIYVGREREHGQHILYDVALKSVVHARTVMRLPNAQKWSKDDIAAVKATPASIHESRKPDVVFHEHVTQLKEEASKPRIARRVYI